MIQKIGLYALILIGIMPNIKGQEGEKPNFELWNKHNDSLYYAMGTDVQTVLKGPFTQLRGGKTVQSVIDNTVPTILALHIDTMPQVGQKVDVFTMAPGKTIYVRVNYLPEKKITQIAKNILGKRSYVLDNYIFGPQTGPLLGLIGNANERGLSLKDNVTKRDIAYSTGIYQG